MIVMALDHTRDRSSGRRSTRAIAGPALFFTRWITHYCAPVFVLLAGTAAWLHGRRLGSTTALSALSPEPRALADRGRGRGHARRRDLFYLGPEILVLQVIWAIGASMVVLAGLVWLPLPAIAAIALVTIGGHNLLDGVNADDLGAFRWLWLLLHEEGPLVPFEGAQWFVVYPLVPWFARHGGRLRARSVDDVAARPSGAAASARSARRSPPASSCCARANLYGDPHPWDVGRGRPRLPRLREVPALAALPRDDARTRAACAARGARPPARRLGRARHGLRTGAALLLRAALPPDPRDRGRDGRGRSWGARRSRISTCRAVTCRTGCPSCTRSGSWSWRCCIRRADGSPASNGASTAVWLSYL